MVVVSVVGDTGLVSVVAKPVALAEPRAELRRPGRQLRDQLQATDAGRAEIASARRELGGMLLDDGLSPLAALRLSCGLSQSQLAERVGMHQSQLSRLECGKHENTMVSTVDRLAVAMGVSVQQVSDAIAASRKARPGELAND